MKKKIIVSPAGQLQYIQDLTGALNITFKSGVATYNDLPLEGNEINDARITEDNHHLYIWNGNEWVDQGDIIDICWENISNKPDVFPSDWGMIQNKPDNYPTNWDNISNKPNTYPSDWENLSNKPEQFPTDWSLITNKTVLSGLDANKSTNPTEGDIYIATDSQKVYVCHSTGTWTEYKVNILSGTDANKPTTYKKDRFYWATDVKKLYWDNGSSWIDISAQLNVDYANNADKVDSKDASDFFQKAGSGEINALTEKTTLSDNDIVLIEDSEDNYEKKKVKKINLSPIISEITISSDCDYIDFTGLDSDIDGGYILECAIVNHATSDTGYYLYVNGDTTNSNYKGQYFATCGGTIFNGRTDNPSINYIPSNSNINLTINIKCINGYFKFIVIGNAVATADHDISTGLWAGNRNSTITKITSLRISADQTNGIGANSKFILKRMRG